jgi:hypothetical protein
LSPSNSTEREHRTQTQPEIYRLTRENAVTQKSHRSTNEGGIAVP